MRVQINFLENIHSLSISPVFARHETFHPRFGWLKKGFDALCKDPDVFLREDAAVVLGVGKNMVRSIRYWCDAFKLTSENQPTPFGHQLFSQWDAYLEDVASLWLLHWFLLKPPCYATAWWITFNHLQQVEFTTDSLFEIMREFCVNLNRNIAESSLRKDVNCILRMYTAQEYKSNVTEDTIDSPFVQLGLLKSAEESKHFLFNIGSKMNLPPEVIVFTCFDYLTSFMENKQQGTVSISRLLYEPNSPGMVFKLSEVELCEAIEKIAQTRSDIHLSDTAGLIQLSFNDFPSVLSRCILESYYT
jgi:hypothetical protein